MTITMSHRARAARPPYARGGLIRRTLIFVRLSSNVSTVALYQIVAAEAEDLTQE